jgi:hypothetical protein
MFKIVLIGLLGVSRVWGECCPTWLRGEQTSKNLAFTALGDQGTTLTDVWLYFEVFILNIVTTYYLTS